MRVTTGEKEKIFKKFGKDTKDSGSVFSQVALFTERVKHLTRHLKRRKLLDYLKRKNILEYRELIKELKLRK